MIKEFREIYNSIFSSNNSEWNLSICDLRNILLEIEDSQRRQEMLSHFVKLCKAALKPIVFSSTKDEKYEKVYNLLCSFVNQFEVESETIKNVYFESCQMDTEALAIGNSSQSRSNSLLRIPSEKLTSKLKIKSKRRRKDQTAQNLKDETEKIKKFIISKSSDITLYNEIFYLRIYEIFKETIGKACAVIDSFVRLNEQEK